MFRYLFLLSLTFPLTACGLAAKVNARNDMQNSLAAYKECLANNPENTKTCDAARLTYEADAQAYTLTASGLENNGSKSYSVIRSHN